ncbi:MAG: hypothetical protein ACKV2T_22360 [Kofleriaceae bacterium]
MNFGAVVFLVCVSIACREKTTHEEPTTAVPKTEHVDIEWIDRCLGERRIVVGHPDFVTMSAAAARAALHGGSYVPEPIGAISEHRALTTWMVAYGRLVAGRDAGALLDAALTEATAIQEATLEPVTQKPFGVIKRDWLLAWGAIELRHRDPKRAARWAAAVSDPAFRAELAAYVAVDFAAAGDVERARLAITALPGAWSWFGTRHTNGYPRALGGAATAVCVALAAPRAAGSPAAYSVVEAAESRVGTIEEPTRRQREYRALALAWARVGDLERALVAISKIQGDERARAMEFLDDFGDAPTVDLTHLARLACAAIATENNASRSNHPANVTELVHNKAKAVLATILMRRSIARNDLRTAATIADAIPTAYSEHYAAKLQLGCARAARGETTIDAVVAELPASYESVLVDAAAKVDCIDAMKKLLERKRDSPPAKEAAISAIAAGRLDRALAMIRSLDVLAVEQASMVHAELLVALVHANRPNDAITVLRAIPEQLRTAYDEELVADAGYRAVIILVAAGDLAAAKELDAMLAPRMARIEARRR